MRGDGGREPGDRLFARAVVCSAIDTVTRAGAPSGESRKAAACSVMKAIIVRGLFVLTLLASGSREKRFL
ncbi:hypothetical protein ACOMHN_063780 [Nucella lapillus]